MGSLVRKVAAPKELYGLKEFADDVPRLRKLLIPCLTVAAA